ncbi:MAG: hypothetical protein IPF55_17055 [Rhodoferax sp.]|nr:hypothetical protein [Rhodoferax sp.]
MNDEDTGVKRDGTASDKHNAAHAAVPPPLPQMAIPVDEPIAGEHQSTPSSQISTLMAEVLHKENLKQALGVWRQLPWPVDDNYLGRLTTTILAG